MAEDIDIKVKKSASELQGISIAGKIIALIVITWLVSLSYYAFAFFLLGMLPSIAAFILDRGAGRFASQTIAACNFTGILPFLFDIGMTYEKSVAAQRTMFDPFTWLVIGGFSLIGLMLIFVLPHISAIIFTFRAEIKLSKLKKEQEELKEEWGDEVRTGG